jgi:S1-C subfamily serine protease
VLDPGLVPLDESLKAGVLAGMAQAVPLRAASGLYVTADGQVLTDARAVQGCGRITLDGGVAAQVAGQSAELGAALLRPDAPLAPRAVARLAAVAPAIGARVLLAGYSLPSGLPAPVLTDAQVAAATGPAGEAGFVTLDAPVTPLDMGGPVLNSAGQVLGIILGDGLQDKRLPQGLSLARDMAQIAPWLAGLVALPAPEAAAGDLPPDALNAAAMGMTVQVLCWR